MAMTSISAPLEWPDIRRPPHLLAIYWTARSIPIMRLRAPMALIMRGMVKVSMF